MDLLKGDRRSFQVATGSMPSLDIVKREKGDGWIYLTSTCVDQIIGARR